MRYLIVSAFAAAASTAVADNWPAWRGPDGTGASQERNLPVRWSAGENVVWKVALPGPGNSTPIVWGEHVFLTQALDGGKLRAVMAFHRSDGRLLWKRETPCSVVETTHKQNPPCSASPVTDGRAVYAHLASAGVVAYDFAGKPLWRRDLGPVLHRWGNGGSPVLYKDLLIVSHGPGEPTFLAALNKNTGETVWKVEQTAINDPCFGSWSTPALVRAGGRDELIMPWPGDRVRGGGGFFAGCDPATGRELWRCEGLGGPAGNEIYAMPVVSAAGDVVVGICGHQGATMAARTGGTGDVTATHRLWRHAEKNPQRIGAGVIHDGRLYLADAPGIVQCINVKSGEVLWKERVGGNLWGSFLLADGRLYVSSLEGQTFVLSAGPKFELLATNDLKEPLYAGIAVSERRFYIRTHGHLYCIGRGE